jgi:hypothetical protein
MYLRQQRNVELVAAAAEEVREPAQNAMTEDFKSQAQNSKCNMK